MSTTVGTSAFVSAVSANVAIAGATIAVFSVIRVFCKHVYALRQEVALAGPKNVPFPPPKMKPGLFGWLRTTVTTPPDVFLRSADLDALMYVRFMMLCLKLFCFAGIFGVCVIMPINYNAAVPPDPDYRLVQLLTNMTQLTNSSIYDPGSQSFIFINTSVVVNSSVLVYDPVLDSSVALDRLSVGNIPFNSPLLYVHVIFAYIFTLLTLYYIRHEYDTWLALRHQWIQNQQLLTCSETGAASTGMGGQMTVLFESIPREGGQKDDDLLSFFKSMYGDTVLAAVLMRNTKALDKLVAKRAEIVAALQDMYDSYGFSNQKPQTVACFPCCGCLSRPRCVDGIDHYTGKLNELNAAIDADQRSSHESMKTAFVTFGSSRAVTWAAQVNHSSIPNKYMVSIAPNSKEIFWPNLTVKTSSKAYRAIFMSAFIVFLVFFWAIPVAFVSSLIALQSLEEKFPFLEEALKDHPSARDFLSGFLASITLVLFQSLLPQIIDYLARLQGLTAESQIQKWCLANLFIFQVVNFFFGMILGGSLLGVINDLSFTGLPSLLGRAVPGVSNFFILYIILLALSGFPMGLLNPVGLALSNALYVLAKSQRQKRNALLIAKSNFDFGAAYPQHLLVFLIGTTYAILSPLVLVFLVVYFMLGYVTSRYSFLYIYINTFESGGIYWPTVASRLLASLIFSHITLIGVFSVKGGYYQSICLVPLLVVTYMFHSYVQERYPKFAEVLPVTLAQSVDDILEQRRAAAREYAANSSPPNTIIATTPVVDTQSSPLASATGNVVPQADTKLDEPPKPTAAVAPAATSAGGAGAPGVELPAGAVAAAIPLGDVEYPHEALKIIRATVDEEGEAKRLLSERELQWLVTRAYIQPSLISPNVIKIVELTEEEKKARASAETVELVDIKSGFKNLVDVDGTVNLFKSDEKKAVDPAAVQQHEKQTSSLYASFGFAVLPKPAPPPPAAAPAPAPESGGVLSSFASGLSSLGAALSLTPKDNTIGEVPPPTITVVKVADGNGTAAAANNSTALVVAAPVGGVSVAPRSTAATTGATDASAHPPAAAAAAAPSHK